MDKTDLTLFWQQVTQSQLLVEDGLSLAYCFARHPQSNKAIVVSNGRVESYLKYQETLYDLYQQGYSVYAIDHIGQGLSSRLTRNPHKGHIDRFSRYVDHFEHFIEHVVKPAKHSQLFLLGHSMGSAIGTLYLERHQAVFSAAVFCAPMYGIKLPLPRRFILWLAKTLNNYAPGKEPNYVPGGHNYQPITFEKNQLTHSTERYERLLQLYQQYPQIQLGSPTNQWLLESLLASERARQIAASNSTTPLLILQAGNDQIVDNKAQHRAIGAMTQLKVIADASHELLIEKDSYRDATLQQFFGFIDCHALAAEIPALTAQ
ncbi:alpha/beta fold hydrolase [Shewanella fodinae]|uniref:alpha/beta fold hydrolase n=1 Tax=Shewanella fodinae TaxID=552357 RepID=UPI001676531B|nr:alpha/beta fold hydrolase [Shewanella fodinae]MCL2908153.1 alpha/beta fold hydrolase [Shewanella fodinae]GGZ13723.1 alpha/beta hydrolase [Shewanella fodinae]